MKKALILFTLNPYNESFSKKLGSSFLQNNSILESLLDHTLTTLNNSKSKNDFDLIISSNSTDFPNKLKQKFPSGTKVLKQTGKTFQEKLENVIRRVFEFGYDKVTVIGNDTPDITKNIINNTFKKLETNDIVLGPSKDGGFYLLGLNIFNPQVFENVNWLSQKTYEDVQRNIFSLGLKSYTLEFLYDIDSRKSLRKWLRNTKLTGLFKLILNIIHNPKSFGKILNPPFLKYFIILKLLWQKAPPAYSSR